MSYNNLYERDRQVRRLAEEERRFKEQYTRRQRNTERAMAEAIDGERADGSPVEHVADTAGGAAALLVLVALLAVVYAVSAAFVAIAVVGGGILVSSLVLAVLAVPVLALVERIAPAGRRSGLPRAWLTAFLAFLAFGCAAALVHGLLFLLLALAGDHRVVPAIPALAPLAAAVASSWYFVTNAIAPEALVAALTPAGVGTLLAILAASGLAGGALMLRRRDRARFSGLGGIGRSLVVLLVPLFIVVGAIIAIGYFLAKAGY